MYCLLVTHFMKQYGVCVHMRVFVCVYVCLRVCVYVCVSLCVNVCVCKYVSVRASAHVCVMHKNPMADSQRSQTTKEQQPREQHASQRTIRVVYRARHPDPPDVNTLNLNNDSEEDTPILPSNQLELEQPGTSGSGAVNTDQPHGSSYYPPPPPPPPEEEEEEEEEEQQEEHEWSFLTQFIGAPSERRGGRDNSNSIDEETDKLKTQ